MARLDKAEAAQVAEAQVEQLCAISYSELVSDHMEPKSVWVDGPSGASYQVELQVFWDSKPDGNLRLIASVDNGGWSAFSPLSRDAIMRPDGTLVGD